MTKKTDENGKDEVDEKLSRIDPQWRFYWCEVGPCACSGCAGMTGITKEEWLRWCEEHEPPEQQ